MDLCFWSFLVNEQEPSKKDFAIPLFQNILWNFFVTFHGFYGYWLWAEACEGDKEMKANDLHKLIGHRFVWRKMQEKNFPKKEFDKICGNKFSDIKTMDQLNNVIQNTLDQMNKWGAPLKFY